MSMLINSILLKSALLSMSLALLTACTTTDNSTSNSSDEITPESNANKPPVTTSQNILTYVSTTYTGTFSAEDPENKALTFKIKSQASNGVVDITSQESGRFSYEPTPNYVGTDQFSYTVSDSEGLSSEESVTVSINPTPTYTPIPADQFFVNLPAKGNVAVTLHPGATILAGEVTKVTFGVPFPRGTVDNISQVIVTDTHGQEIPSNISEVTRWNSLSGDTSTNSLRSALVYVDAIFPDATAITLHIKYGEARILELGDQPSVESTWVSISNGPLPNEYPASESIMEPAAYATFPSDWLSACLLRGRTTQLNSNLEMSWFDDAYRNFSYSAVNDVSDYVTPENLIDYIGDPAIGQNLTSDGYEPWLFDRTSTLFGLYIRTGNVKWLRHAHRASQFYANHTTPQGYFDLKPCWDNGDPCDLKYSYGQGMVIDMMLTGDTSLISHVENIASAGTSWNETYTSAKLTKFWTERHQTYALLAAITAWEATGLTQYAERVNQIINASFQHALNPPNGWTANGSMIHTYQSHEGWKGDIATASPWMSALFADAMMKYYIQSEDENALVFLANLGDYISNVGTYTIQLTAHMPITVVPYYLASDEYQHKYNDGWGDIEHTCNVAGATAKAAWARNQLGGDSTNLTTITRELLDSCKYILLTKWHREDADVNYGKTEWRLSPPRKYSWWFGPTLDLDWTLAFATSL